jgi:2-oxoisovalerate dehydrogenase E1 component
VPVDFDAISLSITKTNRCIVLTEEPVANSFAQALCGRIASECFSSLDAAPVVVGSVELPAIPLNSEMEYEVLPNADKVASAINALLDF